MASTNGDVQTNGRTSASPPSQNAALTTTTTAPNPAAAAGASTRVPSSTPLTSLQDNGLSKRPRDSRLMHLLLTSMGVTAYQERVPLQLLDFAYRHTSSILSDALHLSSDAYLSQQTRARDAPPGGGFRDADGQVSANAVQLAISSRLQYQFSGASGGGLSKEFLVEQAQTRNKIALPRVLPQDWGKRLPGERFVLTGVPWGLKDEWEERSSDVEGSGEGQGEMGDAMQGVQEGPEEEPGVEATEGGDMADLFGEDMDEDMEKEL